MSIVKRYFNADGEELLLGHHILDASEAAYSTENPNDPILSKPPRGKEWKVVDGAPVAVNKTHTKEDLLRMVKSRREEALTRGLQVTGTYRIEGKMVAGHEHNVRLTERLITDVIGLATGWLLDVGKPRGLKVGHRTFLILPTKESIAKLLEAGTDLRENVYTLAEECEVLVEASDDFAATRKAVLERWNTFQSNVEL